MFKVLKARKPYKCDGHQCNREIPKGSLYIRYESFGHFEGFYWVNERFCLDCGFEQMCNTDAWCFGFRLEATKANFEQLKNHEKIGHFLREAKEIESGVYVVGGVKIGGTEYHHASVAGFLARQKKED